MLPIHRSDFDKICRICLKIKRNMSSLYKGELINKIYESFNTKILDDTDLPNSVCDKCTIDINSAFELKQLVIQSQRTLVDIIKNEEFDEKPIVNNLEIKEQNTFDNDENVDDIIDEIVKEELHILTEPKDEIEDDVSDVENIEIDNCELSTDVTVDVSNIEKDEFDNYKCTECGKCFRYLSKYKRHRNTHIPKNRRLYNCKSCDRTYNRQVNLLKHQRLCDGSKPESKKRSLCNQCGETVPDLNLHIHIKHSTNKSYECLICNKKFTKLYNLNVHVSHVHEGAKWEKSHLCNECGKRFLGITDLRAHMFKHSGQKPYKCKLCSAEFCSRDSFRTHMAKHTDTRVRKHPCSVCEKKFYTARMLRNHMRVHTGERPYSCQICEKSFTQTGALHIHMKSHLVCSKIKI